MERFFAKEDEEMLDWIWKGLRMIELDGLGGNVSRGSGQVKFINIDVNQEGAKPDNFLASLENLWSSQQ